MRDRDGETTAPAARPTAEALLQVIGAMLVELRPGSPPRAPHLDNSIERDLALDSLSRAELVLRIERRFGVRLPEALGATARTPRDLLAALERAEASTGAPAAPEPAVTFLTARSPEAPDRGDDDDRGARLAPRAAPRPRAHHATVRATNALRRSQYAACTAEAAR